MSTGRKPTRRVPGGNHPTGPTDIELAERRGKAIRLRRSGMTFDAIATALIRDGSARPGYDRSLAWKDVQAALDGIVDQPAREVKAEQLDRINAMVAALWRKALEANIGAIDQIRKLEELRSRLVGTYSPIMYDITATPAAEGVDLTDPRERHVAGLLALEAIVVERAPRRKAAAKDIVDAEIVKE